MREAMPEYTVLPQTPQDLGLVFPAEWEPQNSIILSCPLNPETWPGNRPALEQAYTAFIAAIAACEPVNLLCAKAAQEHWHELLSAAGANRGNIFFLDLRSNDAWCRDYGPIFLRHPQSRQRAVVKFQYNAWGGKFPPWDDDARVPELLSGHFGVPLFTSPLFCEGGALESNGRGLIMTTAAVLLNPNRNPGLSQEDCERQLREALGAEQILWLPGGLCGDDTDGHIDTLARFCAADTVLAIRDDDPWSPNYQILRDNFRRLQEFRLLSGARLQVVPLPCPKSIRPQGWRTDILPASYANFLIVNSAVLVPTYRQDDTDQLALDIIGQAFPGRAVVPVDCYDIIWEGGALHCLSQQEVAP
ncbi:MAG: agmatine deiminase family protein [Oligosphaeraceae bacterium]|nr:agmatine deiminase family protein [Oligosphaeraceae bacterium]